MSGPPVLRAGHACQPGQAGVAAKTGAQGLSGPSAGGSFPACAASLPTQTVHLCKALNGGSRELQRLWSRFGFEGVMRTQCGKDARIQISGSTGLSLACCAKSQEATASNAGTLAATRTDACNTDVVPELSTKISTNSWNNFLPETILRRGLIQAWRVPAARPREVDAVLTWLGDETMFDLPTDLTLSWRLALW